MTNSIWSVFQSPVFVSGLLAWSLAQFLKVPIEFLRRHRWNWSLIISAGGMPSSHSAVMTAVSTAIGITVGWSSSLFALASAVSAIVVYDAMGVRRQAGFHAKHINKIVEVFFTGGKWTEEELDKLREVIGHSPGEALGGVIFGILIALIVTRLMKTA